jgi:hypothetical protein
MNLKHLQIQYVKILTNVIVNVIAYQKTFAQITNNGKEGGVDCPIHPRP